MRHDLTPMIHLNHDQIARVAHEAYRAQCTMFYDNAPSGWADTHESHRTGMAVLVAEVAARPDENARAAHQRWLDEAVAAGWRHGDRTSAPQRVSAVLLPWEDLTPKYRAKQALLRTIIRHLLRPEAECV